MQDRLTAKWAQNAKKQQLAAENKGSRMRADLQEAETPRNAEKGEDPHEFTRIDTKQRARGGYWNAKNAKKKDAEELNRGLHRLRGWEQKRTENCKISVDGATEAVVLPSSKAVLFSLIREIRVIRG